MHATRIVRKSTNQIGYEASSFHFNIARDSIVHARRFSRSSESICPRRVSSYLAFLSRVGRGCSTALYSRVATWELPSLPSCQTRASLSVEEAFFRRGNFEVSACYSVDACVVEAYPAVRDTNSKSGFCFFSGWSSRPDGDLRQRRLAGSR